MLTHLTNCQNNLLLIVLHLTDGNMKLIVCLITLDIMHLIVSSVTEYLEKHQELMTADRFPSNHEHSE